MSVWDIENGALLSKFGNAHGTAKITAACFDDTGRRLVTAGSNGEIKVWNFSSGENLSWAEYPKREDDDLTEAETPVKTEEAPFKRSQELHAKTIVTAKEEDEDEKYEEEAKTTQSAEVTGVCYVDAKVKSILSVGWDKKIYQWMDEKEKETPLSNPKIIPEKGRVHEEDIVSVCYSSREKLFFTGGHDGSLIAWIDTGLIKHRLHEKDPTCVPEKPTKPSGGEYEA